MAPELFKNEDEIEKIKEEEGIEYVYGKPMDIWSIGVISYWLLTGNFYFNAYNKECIEPTLAMKIDIERLCPKKIDLSIPQHMYEFSDNAKKFMEKIFIQRPDFRPCIEELLKHSWFKDVEEEL